MDASSPAGSDRIVATREIECAVCGAQPGAQCEYVYRPSGKLVKRAFRFGSHSKRVRDAECVSRAVRALLS